MSLQVTTGQSFTFRMTQASNLTENLCGDLKTAVYQQWSSSHERALEILSRTTDSRFSQLIKTCCRRHHVNGGATKYWPSK